jgi:hypothetical protein
MKCPADLSQLVARPLDGKLSELENAALNYIRSFSWSGEVLALFRGVHVAGILGIFLVRLRPSAAGVDEWLWLVVGDVPPAYLVAEGNPTPASALEGYIREMRRWVQAARSGEPVDDLIPVNTPPTPDFADMLERRLDSLERAIESE